MTQKELFKLNEGIYQLTDDIKNYHYTMKVGFTKEGDKCFRIKEKGSINGGDIFLIEDHVIDDDENKHKELTAIAGVGGLSVHSNNNFGMLNRLVLI